MLRPYVTAEELRVMKKARLAVSLTALFFLAAVPSASHARESAIPDPAKLGSPVAESAKDGKGAAPAAVTEGGAAGETAASKNEAAAPTAAAVSPPGSAPAAAPPDSDQYVIGPEDVLLIYVWREDSITRTVPVRVDGKISLPLVDDIQAAGLTPLQLKEAVTEKLKGFVDNPTVTVTVLEANSHKAYVSGEVKSPGVLPLRSEVTLIKLIALVGGFTEWANQKKILIITKEMGKEKRVTVNYKKIVAGDEPDVAIKPGDIIVVR